MTTQADLLLIHGFAIGLDTWFHPKKNHLAGFEVFADEVVSGKAKIFRWTAEQKTPFFVSWNPFFYRTYYLNEREKAQDIATLRDLHRVIHEAQPETVICHSMGSYLFLQYVKRFNLPVCVKKVVFIQADCSKTDLLLADISTEIAPFINVYRFFDPSLWVSSLYHRALRIGLYKLSLPNMKSIYLPSMSWLNPHTASLYDKKLKRLIMSS